MPLIMAAGHNNTIGHRPKLLVLPTQIQRAPHYRWEPHWNILSIQWRNHPGMAVLSFKAHATSRMPFPKRATRHSQLRLCFSSPLLNCGHNYFIKYLDFLVICFCGLIYACAILFYKYRMTFQPYLKLVGCMYIKWTLVNSHMHEKGVNSVQCCR